MMRPLHAAIGSLSALLGFALFGLGAHALLRLAAPEHLALLAIPATMTAAYLAYLVWRGNVAHRIGRAETVDAMTATWSARRSAASAASVIAGAALLCVAAAQPQWGEQSREVKRKGIDVVFALDISLSMLADDVAPSRLAAAKAEMDRLMQQLEGDRVGLVVFAGISFVQSPLTSDYGAIRLYLDRLSPQDLPTQGTAIGRAITEGTQLLTGGEDGASFERADNQLIILFTDGEDHETEPVTAAAEARAEGIHVYTVGVGTPEGSRIPIRGPDGRVRNYMTDRQGEVVVTRLVEDQLVEVAEAGGGRHVRLAVEGAAADELEAEIASYDAQALSSALRQEYQDRFIVFLLPGFVLVWLGVLIGDRRRGSTLVRLSASLALALGLSGCADGGPMREDPRVRRAMETMADDPEAALELLARVPGEAEELPELHYDRGLVHVALEAPRDAQDSFIRALNHDEVGGQVSALVALGNALAAQESYEMAIERYRRALTLDPTHEAARRNLEIALLKLFPPCIDLDDESEDNDSFDTAGALHASVYQGPYAPPGVEPTDASEEPAPLVACGGDADWWALPVVGGSTLDVEVTFERLRDDTGGPPPPEEIAPTDVRIALVNVDGSTPLAVDQGLAESARVAGRRVTRTLDDVAISPLVDADGVAFLRVEVEDPLEYEYDVKVTLTPPCWALEDSYEPNDSAAHAASVEPGQQEARLCDGNADWYGWDVGPQDNLFVDVQPPRQDDQMPGTANISFYAGDAPALGGEMTGQGDSFEVREPGVDTRALLSFESVGGSEGTYPVAAYPYGPCPDNDRFEPNDAQADAHVIDDQSERPPFRHLRLCEGDRDWFVLPLPEVAEEDRETEQRLFSALAEINGPDSPIRVTVYDVSTRRMVATSEPVGSAASDSFLGEAPPTGAIAFARLPWESEAVVVIVDGAPAFYHLSFPHTDEQAAQQEAQQEQEPGEEGEQGEESEDGNAGETGEEEGQQGGEQDPEAEEEQAEDEEGEDPAQTDGEDGEADEARSAEQEEAEREALMRLLDSLESDDVNLPLQQALEAAPSHQTRNPW